MSSVAMANSVAVGCARPSLARARTARVAVQRTADSRRALVLSEAVKGGAGESDAG